MAKVAADRITRKEFEGVLGSYTELVEKISKPVKKGEDTLVQLDKFRYEEAPEKYCQLDPKNENQRLVIPLTAKDLQRMVAWKLKHGKFRPQLMKLASSNTESEVSRISKEAFAVYEDDKSNVKGAIKKLSELKGVGPATASLLLSVHDTENVLFFRDEVYWWLCCKGKKESIKYNFKEHEDLMEKFMQLVGRMGTEISALDVERVGYVMMKGSGLELSRAGEAMVEGDVEKSEDEVVKNEGKVSVTASPQEVKKGKAKKRKATSDETVEFEPRRSKRGKV